MKIRTFREMREYNWAYITSVAFSPDSQKLAVTVEDDLDGKFPAGIVLWDVITGEKQEIKIDELHHKRPSAITAGSFSPTGKELAAA